MRFLRTVCTVAALAVLAVSTGCKADGAANSSTASAAKQRVPVTIERAGGGSHQFQVEMARTEAEQRQGLMFRTDLKPDDGMLFAPYPAEGPSPQEASFWMKNTPTSLDILFIRPDGTIAAIAENTTPYSEAPIASGEPVGAVLEIVGGRAAELDISEGDTVRWQR